MRSSQINLRNLCPPPRRFRPAGEVTFAEFISPPPFVVTRRTKNKARADGIRYEKKAHKYLADTYEDECVIAPWITFTSKGRTKPSYCQPDTILLDIRRGTITIIEIKIKHTADAWWQVRRLYLPVVQCIFGSDWEYIAVELTKWFDPHTKFPERFEFVNPADPLPKLSPDKFHVYIWNERR